MTEIRELHGGTEGSVPRQGVMDLPSRQIIHQIIDHKLSPLIFQLLVQFLPSTAIFMYTRIMVSKGMVSKSKYWISEKYKGIPVCIFTESVLIFFHLCFIRVLVLMGCLWCALPEKKNCTFPPHNSACSCPLSPLLCISASSYIQPPPDDIGEFKQYVTQNLG